MKRLAIGSVILAAFVGCGVTYDEKIDPISTNVQLVMFSTPWCEPCEILLPQLDGQLKQQTSLAQHLKSQLFIVTGAKSSQPPTPEIAAQYKEKLKLSFETAADPWKWTTYKKYYGATGVRVPGAVVLTEDGTVLKTFPPGQFDAAEVVSYLKTVVK